MAGPPLPQRQELFDFVLAELQRREPLCPHRLAPVCRTLQKQLPRQPWWRSRLSPTELLNGKGTSTGWNCWATSSSAAALPGLDSVGWAKQLPRIPRRPLRQPLDCHPVQSRQACRRMHHISWLVALAAQGHRRKVRAVRLHHHPIERHSRRHLTHVRRVLVRQHPRERQVQAHRQTPFGHAGVAAKGVHHAADGARAGRMPPAASAARRPRNRGSGSPPARSSCRPSSRCRAKYSSCTGNGVRSQ